MLDFDLIDWDDAEADRTDGMEELEEISGREIAIVGISAKLPIADNLDEFWSLIRNGADLISSFPDSRRNDVDAYARGRARDGERPEYFDGAYLDGIDRFDYAFFRLSPKEASLLSPNQRLFLETAWKAIEDAGYGGGLLAGSRTGVYVGFNGDSLYDYKRMIADSEPEALSLAVPGNLSSVIAGRLSYFLDLKGPSLCVDTACSSSLVAVHLACQAIRRGECEAAVVGSVKINLLPLRNEIKIGIESSDWRAHTFDDASDGTGAGEGAIAFMLKPLHRAVRDGDTIHAVIKGSAVNQDGSSVGLTAPNAASQEEVIARAWLDAGVEPDTIAYIEAHGTGTKLGDPVEIDGLTRAFRRFTDRRQFAAIGSVKANLGHLDHAAGMAGLLKAVLALRHREIPPQPHFARPNRAIDFIDSPVYVADRLTEWRAGPNGAPRRCGVSAFGMSGTNAHIVLEEAPADTGGESEGAAGQRRRIPLPAYPFEPTRCWVEAPDLAALQTSVPAAPGDAAGPASARSFQVALIGKADGGYTATETEIAQAWGETLGLRQVDLNDNYYEAGGDSILALKIVNRISQQLSIRLEVADLLKHPTVGKLAAYADGMAERGIGGDGGGCANLGKTPAREAYPLASSQYRVFIQEQIAQASTANNTPFGIMAHGKLDVDRFEAVFRQLIDRHAALRTSFGFENGEAVQRVAVRANLQVRHFRCSEDRLDSAIREFVRPFDLAQPPLLRVGLVRLSEEKHLILIDLHHIVSDGVSTGILMKEFCELYRGKELAELPLQYADYAVWQQAALAGDGFRKQKTYWLDKLSGDLPLLNLPSDFARGSAKSYRGRTLKAAISAKQKAKLERLARRLGLTMNSLLFAVYAWVLRKHAGQDDLVIGTLVAGRNHPDLERVIGMFINFLPIRLRVRAELSFSDFATEVHRSVLEAYAHDYPFDWMVADLQARTDRSRNPLYDTMIVYHNEFAMNPTDGLDLEDNGLSFEEYSLDTTAASLDLKLDVWDGPEGGLKLAMQYDTALYMEGTVRRWLDDFAALADSVADNPDMHFPGGNPGLTVAVSATFTAEPMAASLEWWCRQFRREANIEFAPYGQVFQQLLDPKSLTSANEGVNLLLIRFEDWIREDASPSEALPAKLERICRELIDALQHRAGRGTYIVGKFPIAPDLPYSREVTDCLESVNDRWNRALDLLDGVHTIDFGASLAEQYEAAAMYDAVSDREGHMPFTDEIYAAMGTAVARRIVSCAGAEPFKVIVLDCDNTLWKGICGEIGADGVEVEAPYAHLQQFMLERRREGMLLALCSKNNEDDVWAVFERNPNMRLRKEHFAAWRINWEPKPDNVRSLAAELNLGLDSMIFLDDSAKECEEMNARCPAVLTLQVPEEAVHIPHFLKHVWAFDTIATTEEDRRRADYYEAESHRRSALSDSALPMEDFLRGLNLRMRMRLVGPDRIARTSQLTQRTNQFNLSAIRRSDDDIRKLLVDPAYVIWGIEAADRFGDYGFIGVVIGRAERDVLILDTFLLSCRALGRRLEHAVLCELKKYAVKKGWGALEAPFVATSRNEPFRLFLEQTGWEAEGSGATVLAESKAEAANDRGPATEAGPGSGSGSVVRYLLPLERIPDAAPFVTIEGDEPDEEPAELLTAAASTSGASRPAVSAIAAPAPDVPAHVATTPDSPRVSSEDALEGPRNWSVPGLDRKELTHRRHLLPLRYHRAALLVRLQQTEARSIQRKNGGYDEHNELVGDTEMALAALIEETVGCGPIGALDSFFDLGGNSLQAVSLASRIHRELRADLSLRDLFAAPTVRQLAALIDGSGPAGSRPIEPAPERTVFPVAPAQKRLLVLEQLDASNLAYNQTVLFDADGDLDLERFRTACRELVRRHPILAVGYRWEGDGFVGVVGAIPELRIEYRESADDNPENAIAAFVRPFDLTKGPLFRAEAVRTGERKHLLLFDMHHIAADGLSIGLLMKEFVALYEGKALPEPRVGYRDYAIWQAENRDERSQERMEAYWRGVFADGIPILNLPLDFPRPAVRSFAGKRFVFELPSGVGEAVARLASETGATPYMVYLAAYQILLAQLSGQEDIVIGSPVAGRQHADLQEMVGMFAQTVALRSRPERTKTFLQFVAEVRKSTVEALEHQGYPFEKLVELLNVPRDLSRNPLFDTMFSYLNMSWPTRQAAGLNLRPHPYDPGQSRFDLTLVLAEEKGRLLAHWEYATDLFAPQTIVRFARRLIQILRQATRDPNLPLGRIDMLDPEEKAQILFGFNATYAERGAERTIHRLFEERARQTPDRIAVVDGERELTYGELNERANRLARTLRNAGASPDGPVGLLAERSFAMIVGVLAILKAGGAYLPIDPGHPPERLAYLLQDSGAKLLLLQGRLRERLPEGSFEGATIDLDAPPAYDSDGFDLEPASNPDHLAYIIYTSGSTGNPKGVMVEHRSAVHILSQLEKRYPLAEDDCYLLKTTCSFDVSIAELFGWFAGNGQLAILPQGHEKDPDLLLEAIERHGVTHINFVPSMLQALLHSVAERKLAGPDSLKYVFAAGEALPGKLVDQFVRAGLSARLVNLYGPTEATIYAAGYTIDPDLMPGANVPIGRPLPNVQAWIVDGEYGLQPIGVPGELCLSGAGLARGYWRRPELTETRFVANPHVPGDRMYRTGDWARWLPDGNIEYLGRIDRQVKIRGYRIEPGEVETCLRKMPSVEEAIVTVREDEAGQPYLCAYFTARSPIPAGELRDALARELPGYMIPAAFRQLDAIPLNMSGKIDVQALPQPALRDEKADFEPPVGPLETELAQIWSNVLGHEAIGATDSFFEIGGHSLHAIALQSRIRRTFGTDLPLAELFRSPTIRRQANLLARAEPSLSPASSDPIPQAEPRKSYPLSSGQLRMFVLQQLASGNTAYNLPGLFRLAGAVDRERAERALRELIRRHESLRTSFAARDGEFVQFVHPDAPIAIEYREVPEDGLEALAFTLVQPFDLERAPLVRAALIKLSPGDPTGGSSGSMEDAGGYALFFDMHHIVSDGVSLAVMVRDFVRLYEGKRLPELRIQFKDYAVWQRSCMKGGDYARHEAYWMEALRSPLPTLALPTDFPRPEVQTFEGDRTSIQLEASCLHRLKERAAERGATLHMALLAAYALLLNHYGGGRNDLIVGTPSAGRIEPDLEPVIGMFVQTLPIRCRPSDRLPFEKFLQEVKEQTLAAYECQAYPLEELPMKLGLPRDVSRNPLFDTVFVLQNHAKAEWSSGRLHAEPIPFRPPTAKFDLTLEAAETDSGLTLTLEYAAKLFRRETAIRLLADYVRLLRAIASDPCVELRNLKWSPVISGGAEKLFADADFNL